MTANRVALLAVIRRSEGTATSPATKHAGYDVIVTGADGVPEVFSDFSCHPFATGRPSKLIRPARPGSKALYSTAAGGYQELVGNWAYYAPLLGLKDFGPESQDAMALQQIKEFGGLPLIDAGDFTGTIKKIAPLWASLPGANYGQPERAIATLQAWYISAGGSLKE